MIDVSALLSDPALSRPFEVLRSIDSFLPDSEGEAATPVTSSISAEGSVQPASPGDLKRYLPEGVRNTEYIKVYTATQLLIADESGQRSDVIVWQGRRFVVEQLRRWDEFGYTQAFAGRL